MNNSDQNKKSDNDASNPFGAFFPKADTSAITTTSGLRNSSGLPNNPSSINNQARGDDSKRGIHGLGAPTIATMEPEYRSVAIAPSAATNPSLLSTYSYNNKDRFINPEEQISVRSDRKGQTAMQVAPADIKEGWSQFVNVRVLPKYYPNKKLLQNPMPMASLKEVKKRLQLCIRFLSIQALYSDEPLSAKLETPENCQLYLDFWKSSSGDAFYLDIQRRRGDHLTANRYIRKLMDAAEEFDENELSNNTFDRTFKKDEMKSLESFLNKALQSADWLTPETPGSAINHSMESIHGSLMSKRLDARKSGLKQLATMTDLNRTMSHSAKAAALVVLSGKPPIDGRYEERAMDIHDVIIRLILKREFLGDDQCFTKSGDDMVCDDVSPFFPRDETISRNRPRYYEDFMNELFQLGLTILVQALEVANCYEDEFHKDVADFVHKYVTDSMDKTLKDCIAKVGGTRASHSLSTGYLACKALRIFATSDNYLRKCVQEDAIAKECIQGAFFIGKASHSLLEMESEKLGFAVYGESGF